MSDSGSASNPDIFPGTPSHSARELGVRKRLDFILSSLDRQAGRLLDVGCGVGSYLHTLSLRSTTVVGIDLQHDHIWEADRTSKQSNVHLSQMSADRRALADGTVDTIVLVETLEHLVDGLSAIAEAARVLRPGGQVLISVPSKLFPFETHPVKIGSRILGSPWGTGIPLLPLLPRRLRHKFATARLYYVWELRMLLANSGFIVSRVDYLMPSLDAMERKLSGIPLARWLRRIAAWLEQSPFRRFGSTILVQARNHGE